MDILNNIDDQQISMDSYDDYNDIINTGYLMINDGTDMYSVFFVYEEKLEEEIMDAFEELDDEDIFNIMKYADDEGLVWLGIEDEELVTYSSGSDSEEANNYYNDDLNDFISELKQLSSSDIVNLFIFKNTKTKDLLMVDVNSLDEIYISLNKLGK